ncbi:MAG: oligosaccharide flippase family protein [Chitinophagaceae bacterium]|nr:oligosaccharide flippase family protein [Chitinophagaceae bacterium]
MLGSLFGINIIINRGFGTAELGEFTFAYTIAQIVIMGVGGAFSPLLRREIILQNKEDANKYLISVLQLRVYIITFCCVLCSLLFIFLHSSQVKLNTIVLIMLLIKGLDSLTETFYTTFQSLKRYNTFALIKSSNAIINIVAVLLIALLKLPVLALYFSLAMVALFYLICNLFYVSKIFKIKKYIKLNWHYSAEKKSIVMEGWPLILNSIFFQISSRVSVVFVYSISGKIVTGVFSAAIMMITVFTAFANSLGVVFFPRLAQIYTQNKLALFKYLQKTAFVIGTLGTVLCGIFIATIYWQLKIVGHMPPYAYRMFFIAGLSIPFAILSAVFGNVFVILRKQILGMYLAAIILIINCVLYYCLPQIDSILGASFAYLISNVLIVIVFTIFIIKVYTELKKGVLN